jgi:hypothetical protein
LTSYNPSDIALACNVQPVKYDIPRSFAQLVDLRRGLTAIKIGEAHQIQMLKVRCNGVRQPLCRGVPLRSESGARYEQKFSSKWRARFAHVVNFPQQQILISKFYS